MWQVPWPAQGPRPPLRLGADHRKFGDGGSGRARVAPALGNGNAAAGGARGITLGSTPPPCRNSGDGGDGCAATVAQQQLDPGPWMPRDGDFGRRPESPTRCSMARFAASVATAWLWNAGPSASAWWIGLCRATPAPPRNSGGSRTLTRRAAVVATLTRAAVQERVETRHPSACCIRPRLRHGPAPAKAGSRLSGVVIANRESRSAASCAAIVAASVRVCPIGPGGMHVAPCGVGVSRRLCFNNVHACPRPRCRKSSSATGRSRRYTSIVQA